jgi:hypothetical protein
MTRTIRNAALGLLWLALCRHRVRNLVTVLPRNFEVENGGGFPAYTSNPNNLFEVFCVDYANGIAPPATYDANISILSAGIGNTRFGRPRRHPFCSKRFPPDSRPPGRPWGRVQSISDW